MAQLCVHVKQLQKQTLVYKGVEINIVKNGVDTILRMKTKNKNYKRKKITTHTCVRMGEIRSDSHE